MADLEDLNYFSIVDSSTDEALEALRQIRLSRRTPTKSKKVSSKPRTQPKPKLSAKDAAELIKLLKG